MHACMHACIHTYIHTYIHACMHACMHTYMHACMHACIHTYIHTYIYIYTELVFLPVLQWESLKAALHLSARPTKLTRQKTKIGVASCMDRRRRESEGGVYFPKVARRTDAFTLADYTSQALAEQLTLMEQV